MMRNEVLSSIGRDEDISLVSGVSCSCCRSVFVETGFTKTDLSIIAVVECVKKRIFDIKVGAISMFSFGPAGPAPD